MTRIHVFHDIRIIWGHVSSVARGIACSHYLGFLLEPCHGCPWPLWRVSWALCWLSLGHSTLEPSLILIKYRTWLSMKARHPLGSCIVLRYKHVLLLNDCQQIFRICPEYRRMHTHLYYDHVKPLPVLPLGFTSSTRKLACMSHRFLYHNT